MMYRTFSAFLNFCSWCFNIIYFLGQGPYNGNIKQLFSILLDIVASLDTDEEQEESEDDEMETEVSDEDPKPSLVDDKTTSTESDSTISSPTFFVAETEFVHLATTLLSMVRMKYSLNMCKGLNLTLSDLQHALFVLHVLSLILICMCNFWHQILELDTFRDTNDSKMGVARRSNSL